MVFNPTPEQALILQHDISRHARILAGPGTGKSATVVALIQRVFSAERPPRLKLLTFTRAATGELAQKVAEHPAVATQRPNTKGLTVDATIIAAAEEGIIPRPGDDLSEERRLMYVAMTRAKEHLYCTWALRRQGPTAHAGAAPGGLRQLTNFLMGGPVRSQDGAAFLRD